MGQEDSTHDHYEGVTSTPDAEPPEKETDPFKTPQRSSGRVMNGKRKPLNADLGRAALEKKYPALRR